MTTVIQLGAKIQLGYSSASDEVGSLQDKRTLQDWKMDAEVQRINNKHVHLKTYHAMENFSSIMSLRGHIRAGR